MLGPESSMGLSSKLKMSNLVFFGLFFFFLNRLLIHCQCSPLLGNIWMPPALISIKVSCPSLPLLILDVLESVKRGTVSRAFNKALDLKTHLLLSSF